MDSPQFHTKIEYKYNTETDIFQTCELQIFKNLLDVLARKLTFLPEYFFCLRMDV